MTVRTAAPASIWAPVARSGLRGRVARCDANSEPSVQKIGERRTAARPSGSRAPLPPKADGPTRTADAEEADRDADDGEPRQALAEEQPSEDARPRPA